MKWPNKFVDFLAIFHLLSISYFELCVCVVYVCVVCVLIVHVYVGHRLGADGETCV